MEYIGTIFTIVFFAIIIINIIIKLKSAEGSGLQERLNRGLAELLNKNSAGGDYDTDQVKIYDENGNEINFGVEPEPVNSGFDDVVIYDEDGNIMSPNLTSTPPPPPVKKAKQPIIKASTEVETIEEMGESEIEPETDAEMYREFISSNGGSAIVIQEILSKPLALR